MRLQNLITFIRAKKEEYPSLTSKINDMYHLCLAEIAEGESEQNEIDHCIFSIEEIIEEFIEENNSK
jgi:hypothetical protein